MRRSDVRAGALACVIACACAGEDAGDTEATESPPIPDDPEGLHAWALERAYLLWPAWSEVRPTGGTGGARVYLSPDLVDSLRAGATVHPEGATAVRELYGEDLATRTGLAVIRKTDAAAEGGDAWLFLEVFDLDADALPTTASNGAPGCVGCHQAGVDFVQSTLPLP